MGDKPSYVLSKQAVKTLKGMPTRIARHLIKAIEELPEKGDVKPIRGRNTPPFFRLRIGKYRLIFQKVDNQIRIIKIDTRGDVYKHL